MPDIGSSFEMICGLPVVAAHDDVDAATADSSGLGVLVRAHQRALAEAVLQRPAVAGA